MKDSIEIRFYNSKRQQIEKALAPCWAKVTDHRGSRHERQSLKDTLDAAREFARSFLREIHGKYAVAFDSKGVPLAWIGANRAAL